MSKELVTDSQSSPVDLPEMIEEGYYAALKRGARVFWRGTTMVAASGFGRGVLLTLGVVVGVSALASALTGPGLIAGAGGALSFLLGTGKGLATLAVVGTLAAINDVRKAQNRVRAQVAQAREQDYELSRQLQQAQQVQPKLAAPEIPECDHCARELARRATVVEPSKTV